jgi:23S rRNA pseudouridine1911/1915/1917 synthase
MAIDARGREAITHYQVLEVVFSAALVEVRLETGRTHQIRVHMAAIHHPCIGDLVYGADPSLAAELKLNRQWLHARELGFTHPCGREELRFYSEYPPDLEQALGALRHMR